MTENKSGESPQQPNNGEGHDEKAGTGSGDSDWQSFVDSHSEDLSGLENSHTARKFERHAEKVEKMRLVDAKDLTADSFTSSMRKKPRWRRRHADAPSSYAGADPGNNAGNGPRDFDNSWLDIDDSLGDEDFVPGPANIGPYRKSTLAFAVMLALGVIGLILVVFLPSIAGILATIAGLLTLIGAVGLVTRLRGHSETRSDPFDDGARV